MESIIIKQEGHGDDTMEVAMGLQEDMDQEMDGLEGVEAFPPDVKGGLVDIDGNEANTAELNAKTSLSVVSMPSSAVTSQLRMVNLSNTSQMSSVPSQNNQILVRSGGQNTLKKLATPEGQKVVTKLIIAPKAGSSQVVSQQQLLSVGPHGLQPVLNAPSAGLIGQPGVASSVQGTASPSKTYALSQGGVLSPQQKVLTSSTVSGSKLLLSPGKTPPKQTVITFTKSPQKPQYIMLTKSGAATVPTSRPVTMSPSKLVRPAITLASASQSQQSLIVSQAASSVSGTTQTATAGNIPGNVQQLPVSGSKFQYVRLVSAPKSQAQTTAMRQASIAPAPQRALTPTATNSAPVKITMPVNSSQTIQQVAQQKQTSNPAQRLILPATSQVMQGASSGSSSARQSVVSNSSSGSGVGSVGPTINLQGIQGFALIPAQYIQPQASSQQPQPATTVKHESFHVVPSNNNTKQSTNMNGRPSSTTEASGQRPRKPCNCTKSQCLKLYCDCFANGEFCANCNCNNCYNNLDHEEERQRAIKTCLERNPNAFHPKIGKGRGGSSDRRHNKGCNCKRSGCLKNYCECYEAKIMCSSLCKCVGCKNFEESPDRKTLMHLADAAEVRHQQQTAAKTKLSSQIQDVPARAPPPATGQRLPYTFVTPEVAEATCACLVAQAEEAERTRQQEMMEERMILQEFGRCLMQVIQSATRTKAPSPVP